MPGVPSTQRHGLARVSDKFAPSDRVILKKDRLSFEDGTTQHKPNVGIVQGYARSMRKPHKPTVVVRWHKGLAQGYTEDQLEKVE